MAYDDNSLAQRIVDLDNASPKTETRDLSLKQALTSSDPAKFGFTETRTNVHLAKGETYIVDDITSG